MTELEIVLSLAFIAILCGAIIAVRIWRDVEETLNDPEYLDD